MEENYKNLIERNKTFLRKLMFKYSQKQWQKHKDYYRSKYKKWSKNEYNVDKYASRKFNPLKDEKYMYLYSLWKRLDFETNNISKVFASKGIYTEEHYKEMHKPIIWEEIKNIKIEDYI